MRVASYSGRSVAISVRRYARNSRKAGKSLLSQDAVSANPFRDEKCVPFQSVGGMPNVEVWTLHGGGHIG